MAETFGEVAHTLCEEEELPSSLDAKEVEAKVREYEKLMRLAAKEWRFEDASKYRDLLQQYQKLRILEEDL